MKTKEIKHEAKALTRIEVLVIVAVLAFLAVVILSELSQFRKQASPVACVNNLKQVALGLRMWAGENDDKHPTQVSTNQHGSLEWVGSKQVYRHFLVAGAEIGSPKLLKCPQEKERIPAMSFFDLKNENISYFINLSAVETNDPLQLLSGDRHLTRNGFQYANGSYLIPTQQVLTWGLKPHENAGNIALTDGSVQQTANNKLQVIISGLGPPTNWLAFP